MKTPPPISFVRQGNHCRVVAANADLMQFCIGDLYLAGSFLVHNIRFRADGPLRITTLGNAFVKREFTRAHIRQYFSEPFQSHLSGVHRSDSGRKKQKEKPKEQDKTPIGS